MNERLTRQGVRDLNPVGHNGHRDNKTLCKHWFTGLSITIGYRWAIDTTYGEEYKEPIRGRKCAWCGEKREL